MGDRINVRTKHLASAATTGPIHLAALSVATFERRIAERRCKMIHFLGEKARQSLARRPTDLQTII